MLLIAESSPHPKHIHSSRKLFVVRIAPPCVSAIGHEGTQNLHGFWVSPQKPGLARALPSSNKIAQSSAAQTSTVGQTLSSGPCQSYRMAATGGLLGVKSIARLREISFLFGVPLLCEDISDLQISAGKAFQFNSEHC